MGKSWHDSVYSEKKHVPFASGTSVYGNGDPAVLSYGMLLWKKQGEYNRKRKKDRKEMEEKIEIAMAGRENVNGGEPDMTEEDLKTLRILLEGLEPLPDDNLPLYRIAYAEARTYFSGEKSLDEVIDVIQNRATLYMNEK